MASTLLATKVEEESHTLKTLIHAFAHLYRKRLVVAFPIEEQTAAIWEHESMVYVPEAKTWTLEEKELRLAQIPLPNNKLGPVYQDWHKQVSDMENIVLRQLGFTLYWIPDSHPHKFILYFCRVLELTDVKVCIDCMRTRSERIHALQSIIFSCLFSSLSFCACFHSFPNELGTIATILADSICVYDSKPKSL
jgi:hypothetical protein